MRLGCIRSGEVDHEWPKVAALVENAVSRSRGKYRAEDIKAEIASRDMQIWKAFDENGIHAIAITQVRRYPRMLACCLLCCTGEDAKEWVHLIAEIEKWAKTIGCKTMTAEARPGWERVLKGRNYEKTHVYLEKAL